MPPPRLHPPPIIEIDSEGLTPELKVRCIEAELKNEEKKIDNEWQCCCFKEKTDARMIKYLTQISILVGIIILCIVRLSDPRIDGPTSNTYVSILSLCLGIICPSPKLG